MVEFIRAQFTLSQTHVGMTAQQLAEKAVVANQQLNDTLDYLVPAERAVVRQVQNLLREVAFQRDPPGVSVAKIISAIETLGNLEHTVARRKQHRLVLEKS